MACHAVTDMVTSQSKDGAARGTGGGGALSGHDGGKHVERHRQAAPDEEGWEDSWNFWGRRRRGKRMARARERSRIGLEEEALLQDFAGMDEDVREEYLQQREMHRLLNGTRL